MDVHSMGLASWVCETPLLGRAQHRLGVNTVWIESQAVNCPVARRPVKAPVACHSRLTDVRKRAQRWRNRAVVDDMLSDAKLKQWHARERIGEIGVLS